MIKKIGQIIKRALTYIVFYALKPFPRKKSLVVFGADAGSSFAGNPKYLFLEAQRHPEIEAVWITKNKVTCDALNDSGYTAYMHHSLKGIWAQLRARTAILSINIKDDFSPLFLAGAISVNAWHGVGLKRSWFRNRKAFAGRVFQKRHTLAGRIGMAWAKTNMTKENYIISTSEAVSAYYPETYHVDAGHVLNLGQARNDVFYNDMLEDGAVPDIFRKKKIITYMPTHRNYGEEGAVSPAKNTDIDLEKLNKLMEEYGYIFVIKQHRWLTQQGSDLHTDSIIDITRDNYNIDTQLILKYTDILITDYSSCYTDYLLLDRPVLFYCYDLEEYLGEWELNFDYDTVTPGPKAFGSDELLAQLELLLQGQDDYREERMRVKDIFYSPENQKPVAKKQMDYIIKNIIFKDKK